MPSLGEIILGLIVIPLVFGPIFWYAYAIFKKRGKQGIAPYLLFAILLWPVFGYMGGQGFSGVVFLMAVPVLLFMRPIGLPRYTMAGLLFLVWLVVSEFWGTGRDRLVDGNLLRGTFTIDMTSLRFGLILIASAVVLAGARKTTAQDSVSVLRWTRYVTLFVALAMLVTAFLYKEIASTLANIGFNDYYGTIQDMLRNANAFLLLLPLLLAWMWDRIEGPRGKGLSVAVVAIAMLAFALTGAQSAALGILLILGAMAAVYLMPKSGFKCIFGAIAGYIIAAPLLFKAGVAALNASGIALPASFFSRLKGWEAIGEKIAEKPLFGHGLESTYAWGETFTSRPEWLADAEARFGPDKGWANYEIINSHPHNMAMQIWVDTGFIGAALFASAIVLFGWRLSAPHQWSPVARYAAAGLTGAALSIFSFGYSMWNEAFWAGVAIASVTIMLQAHRDRISAKPSQPDIVS